MFLALSLLLFPALGLAGGETGVGISLGNPTGLNLKRWLDKKTAVDGGLGMSFGKKTNGSLHSDYLFHTPSAFYLNDVHPLDLYYGIGGRMEFSDEIELGVRLPVGLAYREENNRADIFGEVAPVINFLGGQGLELHILFGARYYL